MKSTAFASLALCFAFLMMGAEANFRPLLASLPTNPHKPVIGKDANNDQIDFAPVGRVRLFGNETDPRRVVLYMSGTGWDAAAADLATAASADGRTLVVGIDWPIFRQKLVKTKAKCLYPAGHLEALSMFIQKKLGMGDYLKPVLAGSGEGAAVAYATICQAPGGTFSGGLAVGFSPKADVPEALCKGSGKLPMTRRADGFSFGPVAEMPAPFEALQTAESAATVEDFFKNTGNVNVGRLPYESAKNWAAPLRQSLDRLAGIAQTNNDPIGTGTSSLPLSFIAADPDPKTPMAVFLSGDGGWTSFTAEVAQGLANRHWPVVGLNSQSYFWKKKAPETAAADLASVIETEMKNWGKSRFVLVGYSFGAEVAPFIFNRLPEDLRKKCSEIALMSPGPSGDFEIHVAGMMHIGSGAGPYDVVAELATISSPRVRVIRGDQEGVGLKEAMKSPGPNVQFVTIPGSHHYNNDPDRVAREIAAD